MKIVSTVSSSALQKEEKFYWKEERGDLSPGPQESERPPGCRWERSAACPSACHQSLCLHTSLLNKKKDFIILLLFDVW